MIQNDMRRWISILCEGVRKPLPKVTYRDLGGWKIVAGRSPIWVTAFHGTAQEFEGNPKPMRDSVVWATMTPRHAASYASSLHAELDSTDPSPHVLLLKVDIFGFLVVDGKGQELGDVERGDWTGFGPFNAMQEMKLPGILFKNVYDIVEDDSFRNRANILAIADVRRIRPMFGDTAE